MQTLWKAIASTARARPRALALIDDDQLVCYGELTSAIRIRSARLREIECEVLAIALDNSVEWVLWDLAAMYAGVICVPLPPFFSHSQLSHVLSDAAVDTVLDQDGLRRTGNSAVGLQLHSGGDNVCKITYTSGSTGRPKGVCLGTNGMQSLAEALLETFGCDVGNNHLSVLPLGVLLENVAGVYPSLLAGHTVHLRNMAKMTGDPLNLWHALGHSSASSTIMVPALLRSLVVSAQLASLRLPALQFLAVGGAPVSQSLLQQAAAAGLPAYQGYGLSECGSVVSVNTPRQHRAGTAGKVLPHVSLRIDSGQIIVDDPVAVGYLGDGPLCRMHTGDYGSIDRDGFLSVHGRMDNLLVTSTGRNIQAEWVETLLLDHPCIAQAIIYAQSSPLPGALLVPVAEAAHSDIQQAVEATNRELPEYARIDGWRTVDPFTIANGQLTGNGRPVRARIHHCHLTGE